MRNTALDYSVNFQAFLNLRHTVNPLFAFNGERRAPPWGKNRGILAVNPCLTSARRYQIHSALPGQRFGNHTWPCRGDLLGYHVRMALTAHCFMLMTFHF